MIKKITKTVFFAAIMAMLLSCQGGEKIHYAEIETSFGNMKVELYNSTPIHRDNFIKLVNEGFYDDLLFHRVIPGFMIQGGDPDSKTATTGQRLGGGGPGYTLKAEIGAPHFKGTLAAARTSDAINPNKESSGSQFYVVQGQVQNNAMLQNFERSKGFTYNEAQRKKYMEIGGTPSLDKEYTVFGEVVEGLDVIDKIAVVPRDRSDRPNSDLRMQIRILK